MTAPARQEGDVVSTSEEERLIAVPARTRVEIGELGFYLEQTVRSLREVNTHLRGSSETMPSVLHELRTINSMTEAATVRVLEETEALVDVGRQAVALLSDAERAVAADAPGPATQCLTEARGLVAGSNDRALAIMAALEFQDLTSQRVHRLFGVLEEVIRRLARIQSLVDLGQDLHDPAEAPAAPEEAVAAGKSGQALADELMQGFER
jgi:chemotaxis regulatin CheY-phosphate phosphatase CheZ